MPESMASKALPVERDASGSPLGGGFEYGFEFMVFHFPLSEAEHRRGGRTKARGLSEPAKRRASFRVLRQQRRRAG